MAVMQVRGKRGISRAEADRLAAFAMEAIVA